MFLTRIRFNTADYPVADRYPFDIALFRNTARMTLDTPVTFFVGENGSGKSTLLKAISDRCGIHIWGQADEARLADNPYERELARFIDIDFRTVNGAFFASETFRRFALLVEEWAASDPGQLKYFGGESLITKSHGQCHMAYFRSRFRLKGLYLLDEPENALSPGRQLELARLLSEEGERGHAQFIVCTHSPLLMSARGARIFSFDGDAIRPVTLEGTEHFRVYRDYFEALRKDTARD